MGIDIEGRFGCKKWICLQKMKKVDVIYRRVDDAFLDPEVGDPKSVLGGLGKTRLYQLYSSLTIKHL